MNRRSVLKSTVIAATFGWLGSPRPRGFILLGGPFHNRMVGDVGELGALYGPMGRGGSLTVLAGVDMVGQYVDAAQFGDRRGLVWYCTDRYQPSLHLSNVVTVTRMAFGNV